MGESTEPVAGGEQTSGGIWNRRLLIEIATITMLAALIGLIAVSARFLAGVLFGGAMSVVNFLWMDRSLAAVFRNSAVGIKPRLLAVRYILRYVVIGLILLGIYLTNALPIVAVLIGLASFALAVVFDGIVSIFRNP